MPASAPEWIERLAQALGTTPPSAEEVDALLQLAGTAAHASERTAAPISCWLAARSGRSPEEALSMALALAEERDGPAGQ